MSALLDHSERQLLAEYPISYLLADPQYAGLIDQKLHAAGVDVTMAMNRDGYVLYRITRS
jgi:hypothetical protein